MVKAAYLLVALAALAPAAVIAATSLYLLTQTTALAPETERVSGERSRLVTLGVCGVEGPIHPRGWAAVAVLLGTVLWSIGIVFLLFIRM